MILKWTIIEGTTLIIIFAGVLYPDSVFIAGACVDKHNRCSGWAKSGECRKNALWMLQNCPKSCQVCLGVPACINIYNDQYCQLHLGNCWRPATAADLVKNCRKTCVCKCCSSIPPVPTNATHSKTTTTKNARSTGVTTTATILYTTTTARQTTAVTNFYSTSAATVLYSTSTEEGKTKTGTKAITIILQTTTKSKNATRQDLGTKDSETSSPNTLMLSAIIAGVVAFIGVVGIVLFCFWRRKRSGSLNQQKWPTLPQAQSDTIRSEEIIWLERQPRNDSRNPILGSVKAIPTNGCNNQVITTESCEFSDASDTISRPPDTPFYHVLEGPDGTGTIMNQALSALNEQSSERPRTDSDYDEPVLKGACAAIGSQSKGREKEAVYEDANPKRLTDAAGSSDTLDANDEYCYSYTTDLSLKDEKSRQHEGPKTDGPLYHSLEGPNTGYEALEGAPATTNGYTPMEGLKELSGYQPLQKATRSVYQPLRKTTTEPPRRAFTRK